MPLEWLRGLKHLGEGFGLKVPNFKSEIKMFKFGCREVNATFVPAASLLLLLLMILGTPLQIKHE